MRIFRAIPVAWEYQDVEIRLHKGVWSYHHDEMIYPEAGIDTFDTDYHIGKWVRS